MDELDRLESMRQGIVDRLDKIDTRLDELEKRPRRSKRPWWEGMPEGLLAGIVLSGMGLVGGVIAAGVMWAYGMFVK